MLTAVRVDDRLVDDGGRLRCHALGGVTYHPGRQARIDAGTAREVVLFAGAVLHRELDVAGGSGAARFRSDLDRPSGRAIEIEIGDGGRRELVWIADGRVTETDTELDTSRGRGHRQTWMLAAQVVDGRRWLPRLVAERVTDAAGHQRCRDVLDDWTDIGSLVVPARRRIDAQLPDRRLVEIDLRHHQLVGRP